MRVRILTALALAFSALALAPPPRGLFSQETATPPLYLMADILVDVSRAAEYESVLKDLITALDKHGFPVQFDTYSTDDSHYYIIYGLENYAGVDRWKAAWSDLARKMGPDAFQSLRRRMAAAELKLDYRFWYFRTDISFLPQNERLKPKEIGYYTWDYVWLVPGAEAEFEALNKQWIALSRSRGARDPFLTYAGDLGSNGPVYCWFEYGKSAADYARTEEKFWKSLGDEGAALSKRTRALIRRTETKTGRYRPDLSYASPQAAPAR
jgi:hypothetical protein